MSNDNKNKHNTQHNQQQQNARRQKNSEWQTAATPQTETTTSTVDTDQVAAPVVKTPQQVEAERVQAIRDANEAKAKEMKLKATIKAAEDARRQELLSRVNIKVEEMTLGYDAWWSLRNSAIPTRHYKEIVLADFLARGLSKEETCANYDEALGKYGVKLK